MYGGSSFLTKYLVKATLKLYIFGSVILCFVRFMVDSDVVGCCWIELPKGTYRVREEKALTGTDPQNPTKVGVGVVHQPWSDLAGTYHLCSVRLYTSCF